MLSISSKRTNGLFGRRLLLTCRSIPKHTPFTRHGALARLHSDDYDNYDGNDHDDKRPDRPFLEPMKPEKRTEKYHESQRLPLKYTTLGKTGEVFVVREKPRARWRYDLNEEEPTSDTSTLPPMLSQIEGEKAPFNALTVNDHIEEFRSRFPPQTKLEHADWVDIQSKLYRAFTVPQLKKFVFKHTAGLGDQTNHFPSRGNTLTTEWRPGTSDLLETGPISKESLISRVLGRTQGKERIVEYILRDIWELGIQNETGQLDIRLPIHHLSLLIDSQLFSFEELAGMNDVKIDLTHSLGLIRSTGSQKGCETIREIIKDTLKRARQEEVALLPPGQTRNQLVSQTFTSSFISWIGQTYKVALEQNSSQLPIRMHYLVENKASVEQVRRIINLALNKATASSVPFSTYLSASKPSAVFDVQVGDTASWPDRKKPWFRWGGPADEKDLTQLPGYFSTGSDNAISDQLLKFLQESPSMQADLSSVPAVRDSIRATVGKCLFYRLPYFTKKEVSASQLGNMRVPRTFINYVPRALQLIRSVGSTDLEKESKSYHIHLVPTSFYADAFPKLELDVRTGVDKDGNQAGDCELRSAKAILAQSNVDYLLPESATDIRLTRSLTHDILEGSQEVPSLETILATVVDCLNASMDSEQAVPLPPFTSVTLPNYLLQNSNRQLDPNGTSTAEYLFVPVNDIQGTRTRRFALRNQPLFYSSYESGPFGPQTNTDLYLQMEFSEGASTPSRSNVAVQRQEFTAFYGSVCTLASELDLHQHSI
ncbi:mitochondrial inner-membrane-bound regulator-domain-containing protein [Aspergillus karnatakaensis]|uniref:putative respiratory complex assembly protein Rmp1 n=1 Tax=Aspergillus karnatakaensis TaxID=1810916 RepID=UPI003CCD8B87